MEGYVNFLGAFVTILIAAYTVSALQTVRSEEDSSRADSVLATPIGRGPWLGSHILTIAVGALLISLTTGIGTGLAAAVTTGEWSLVADIVTAHLVLLPAAWVVLGLGAALFGVAPRAMAPVCWSVVAIIGVVDFFGALLNLPGWVARLSPMDHLPAYPVEELAAMPVLVTTVLAVALALVGIATFRRRQLNTHSG